MTFDLRLVIGFLFSIMGGILLFTAVTVSGALASGVPSATVDASSGAAMLVFGVVMVFAGRKGKGAK